MKKLIGYDILFSAQVFEKGGVLVKKKNYVLEYVLMAIFLTFGCLGLHFTGNLNIPRLIIMTLASSGGMLLLIVLEWFFLVYRKKN